MKSKITLLIVLKPI